MNVMIVGGGGREHAIIKKLRKSRKIENLYALPGNGGITLDGVCAPVDAKDIDGIVKFAKSHDVDFAVIAPENPLVLGAVDALHKAGIKCFGPDSRAAVIEGSKIFAKNLMKKYGIPTAAYEIFDKAEEALQYLRKTSYPTVIKADGLALAKGVIIAADYSEAEEAVNSLMSDRVFGESGARIVVEQYLQGMEVSVLAFTDGHIVVPMVSSMDHKRIGDADTGGNTGGMGAVAPNPFYTEDIARACMERIFLPTISAMRDEGRVFKGCLYFGLMICDGEPYVIEYNCRFGDPETQVVLPLLKTDLLDIMTAVEDERLGEINVEFSDEAACCVVLASGGYPKKYETGKKIDLGKSIMQPKTYVFHAGTRTSGDGFVTSGGRVLGVTSVAPTLGEAIKNAYSATDMIKFDGMYRRSDIGKKALGITE